MKLLTSCLIVCALSALPVGQLKAQGNACGYTLGSAIFGKWQQLGGERGGLGCPTMNEAEAGRSPQGTSGRYVTFRGGGMTVTTSGARAGQAFEYHGAIYQVYAQLGGSVSWLGFPVSDEYDAPGGRRSDFEGGYIFWDRASGQARAERAGTPTAAGSPAQAGKACGYTLGSGILGKWQQLGGERGLLGCAVMNEADANRSPQGSTGKWANFQHGLITWMFTGPKVNQGFEVHGLIKNLYMQMGGSGSYLGFPMSDEYDAPGGRRSDFEGGYIFWDRASNQVRAERAGTPVATVPPQRPSVQTEGHIPAPAGGMNYPKPQMGGAIVDHCVTWATSCGQAGADQFCRLQGHERAASFQTFAAGRTYVVGSRQICEGSYCMGFAQVTCAGGSAAAQMTPPSPGIPPGPGIPPQPVAPRAR